MAVVVLLFVGIAVVMFVNVYSIVRRVTQASRRARTKAPKWPDDLQRETAGHPWTVLTVCRPPADRVRRTGASAGLSLGCWPSVWAGG